MKNNELAHWTFTFYAIDIDSAAKECFHCGFMFLLEHDIQETQVFCLSTWYEYCDVHVCVCVPLCLIWKMSPSIVALLIYIHIHMYVCVGACDYWIFLLVYVGITLQWCPGGKPTLTCSCPRETVSSPDRCLFINMSILQKVWSLHKYRKHDEKGIQLTAQCASTLKVKIIRAEC